MAVRNRTLVLVLMMIVAIGVMTLTALGHMDAATASLLVGLALGAPAVVADTKS